MIKSVTALFMGKTLKVDNIELEKVGFINAYIRDINQTHDYENCVYFLFKPSDMDLFMDFLNKQRNVNTVVDDYDYEGGYVVIVYQLNPLYKSDYELVKKGLYSKTSKNFQNLFPKVIKIIRNGKHKDEISLQYRVFNRTQDLIDFWEEKLGVRFSSDQELWEGFDLEKETLNIDKIKNDVESTLSN